jgi:hypothetical protein
LESDAHAVPSPHQTESRASKVAFTRRATARRRLSRLTRVLRTRLRAASVSPWSPVATI